MATTFFRTPDLLIMGTGSIKQIGEEAKKLGSSKALIVTDKIIVSTGLLDKVTKSLTDSGISFEINDEIVPEPPFEMLEEIKGKIIDKGFDLFIGIGGGSVLDSTKMLAIMMKNDMDVREMIGTNIIPTRGLPFILAPTTSGTGSEVTFNAIFTDNKTHVKRGIVSPYLLPDVAIVDAELTISMPASVTAATGMDALVHAVESYTAIRSDELNDGIALQAIKLISRSLRKAVYNGNNLKAREDMSMGSLLAGIALANAGVGAVHALAYPLGGKFKVPHGVSNSLLLPYVMKYNVVSEMEKFKEIAIALGENIEGLSTREAAEKAVESLGKLSRDIGIPTSLVEVGVRQEDLKELAAEAIKIERLLGNNPRKLTLKDIEEIYQNALDGGGPK
ncbi:iron-containing alcohol dehydrogenase [Sporosarcina sp. FA9]|uniref:iron-containing alcohol dehydrogenase n=1 Tax=Sporosarcina sp. FA9 TaxID=3413030 RepID=UPI003F65C85F